MPSNFLGVNPPGSPPASPAGFGQWATIQVIDGNDDLTSTNIGIGQEGNCNNVNWLWNRSLDIVSGQNTSALHGAITVGGTWTFTPGGSTNMDAVVATGKGTGVAGRFTSSTTGQGLNVYALSSAAAASIEQDGAGDAVDVVVLNGNGVGVRSDTSGGTGVPVYAKAPGTAGTAAILVNQGPVQFSGTNGAAPVGAPGANTLYGANVMKAACVVTCTGGGASTVTTINRSFNVTSVVMDASGLFVVVTFTTAMADKYYAVAAQYETAAIGGTTGETFLQNIQSKAAGSFALYFASVTGTPFSTTGPQDLRLVAGGTITITIHGWQ